MTARIIGQHDAGCLKSFSSLAPTHLNLMVMHGK